MSVLAIVIPISLLLGFGFVVAFLWAVDNGQMSDLDTNSKSLLDQKLDQTNEEQP